MEDKSSEPTLVEYSDLLCKNYATLCRLCVSLRPVNYSDGGGLAWAVQAGSAGFLRYESRFLPTQAQDRFKLTQSRGKLRARVTNLGRSRGHRMIACPACLLRIGVAHTNLGKQAAFGHFLSMRSSHHRSSSRQMDTNYNVRDRVGGSLAMRVSQRKDLKGKEHVVSGKSCEGWFLS